MASNICRENAQLQVIPFFAVNMFKEWMFRNIFFALKERTLKAWEEFSVEVSLCVEHDPLFQFFVLTLLWLSLQPLRKSFSVYFLS